jgi:hypothetical protein
MISTAAFVNAIWYASAIGEARRFQAATRQVLRAQSDYLATTLRTNAQTDYGKRHNFSKLRSVDDFRRYVPLTTYDDYTDDIRRIGQGHQQVLTADPVLLFEPSSGSTAASKLIPYTAALKREFQRGIAAWIVDLFRQQPALRAGSAYWSVSPLVHGKRRTESGIPIGFESDSAYLGFVSGLMRSVLAVPDDVKLTADVSDFRYLSLLHMLRRRDLRLISVWNPTFLSLLIAPLPGWWDALLRDIGRGAAALPSGAPVGDLASTRFRADPRRAAELAGIGWSDTGNIWPDLGLLSCWMDGPSAPYASTLQSQFPKTHMQGKGLLATECFATLPINGQPGAVLAVRSHFFEFVEATDADQSTGSIATTAFAHELSIGKAYSLIVTTGGGLYRYRLNDIVEVVGHINEAPLLRFVGKADRTADYFGEKLNERFVANALQRLFSRHGLTPLFAMLAPHKRETDFRYVLLLEAQAQFNAQQIGSELDSLLSANFHYDYCRRLEQLGPVEVIAVTDGVPTYLSACQSRGMKMGDIKPVALQTDLGWVSIFETAPARR